MTNKRYRYIIGDLQGCYSAFTVLLKKIDFDDNQDLIYLCGDIVARGENSLECLRLAKSLSDKGALQTVLGNHDITLIANWLNIFPAKEKDKTGDIFKADDCDELLNWLRQQPFLIQIDDKSVMTHAGIPSIWTTKQAKAYADELSIQLSSSKKQLKRLLPKLYDKKDNEQWKDDLNGYKRLRLITNYFTRMRLCDKDGNLELKFKGGLDDELPDGYQAWFAWQTDRAERIYFGHWAGLEGKIDTPFVRSLDGGCVWGGQLLAYRLEDGQLFGVDNPAMAK